LAGATGASGATGPTGPAGTTGVSGYVIITNASCPAPPLTCSAICTGGKQALGGGFLLAASGQNVRESAPRGGGTGWQVTVDSGLAPTVYAICGSTN
jgi:hypothetical protein